MTPEHLRRAWRILVVDDDEVDRMAIRRLLSGTGIDTVIEEAGDVAGAVHRLESHPFDCLLVDFHLPDGDGRDVLRASRTLPRPPGVVMVTGQNDQDLAVELMKEGADDYLTKGRFDAEDLTRGIRYALGVARARQSDREAAAVNQSLADAAGSLGQIIEVGALLPRIVDLFVPSLADGAEIETPWGHVATGAVPEANRGEPSVTEHPMLSSDLELGTLRLWRARGRPETSALEARLVESLVDRSTAALDNARLYADLHEQSRLVEELNRVGRTLAGQLDPERIVETVVQRAVDLTDARVGGLYLPATPSGRQTIAFWWERDGGRELDIDEHVLRNLAAGRGVASASPPGSDDVLSFVIETAEIDHAVIVPFPTPDGGEGVLVLGRSGHSEFRASDRQMAEGIAGWAGIALGNAELFRQTNAAVRARDEVIGIVSHDLRNPLNVILITSAMMLEMGMVGPGDAEHIERMRKAATGMNRLIRDLLDATRIDAGGLSVDPESVPVAATLAELRGLMEPQAQEAGVELVVEEPADVSLRMDHERMVQLLGNLVGNAIKVMPDGGRVTVSVDVDDEAAEFVVADTGPGIPTDEMPHLFDRFWQGTAKRKDGAGLGLPICRGIAEAHGGTIHAESTSSGAVFRVRLPVGAG